MMTKQKKILVSSCLLCKPVRYNGTGAIQLHPVLRKWQEEGRVIVFCPEVAAGLPIPRSPAEINGKNCGVGILNGEARVVDATGTDVTDLFVLGAQKTLTLVKKHNIKIAILKARSPSCGSSQTYDGGRLVRGQGVTSALLSAHHCKVFNEEQLKEAKEYLNTIEEG